MNAVEEPVTYTGTVDRDGITAEFRITIPRGEWVPDHDELSETVGVQAMRGVRQAVAARDNTRSSAPPTPDPF